jgi:hypothetical protein
MTEWNNLLIKGLRQSFLLRNDGLIDFSNSLQTALEHCRNCSPPDGVLGLKTLGKQH